MNSADEHENPWVGRVLSIQKRVCYEDEDEDDEAHDDADDDVWLHIRWYYSPQDLLALCPSNE